MRSKGVKPEDDDVPMSEKLDKIESVPISSRIPNQRMDDVDDIVTWLQNGNDDSVDPTRQFKKIDQMHPTTKCDQKPEDTTNFAQLPAYALDAPAEITSNNVPCIYNFRTCCSGTWVGL